MRYANSFLLPDYVPNSAECVADLIRRPGSRGATIRGSWMPGKRREFSSITGKPSFIHNQVLFIVFALILGVFCFAQPASAESSPQLRLKIGQISNSVAFFPIYVARKEGYFKDEGLAVNDPVLLGTGAKLAAALVSGSIDVGGGVMTDAFNIENANQHAKVISALVDSYYVDIAVGKDFSGPGSKASLMEKIKALKGTRIGITGPGSGTEALVTYLFALADMNPATDATLVNLGAQATAVLGALKAGRVDALSFFQPIGQEVESRDLGSIYISPARGDVPSMKGEIHGVAIASRKALQDKPKAIRAYIRAIGKALHTIHNKPKLAAQLLGQYEHNLDKPTVSALIDVLQGEIADSPKISEESYKVAVQFHQKAGLISGAPSYDTLIAKDVIDDALDEN